jgi:hypothetical protein
MCPKKCHKSAKKIQKTQKCFSWLDHFDPHWNRWFDPRWNPHFTCFKAEFPAVAAHSDPTRTSTQNETPLDLQQFLGETTWAIKNTLVDWLL